ncbi:MAG: M23 family metallopeptidase [Firmicutes bacterium]|nr:M23 family metallopeptidase [Bacillota bacterium]
MSEDMMAQMEQGSYGRSGRIAQYALCRLLRAAAKWLANAVLPVMTVPLAIALVCFLGVSLFMAWTFGAAPIDAQNLPERALYEKSAQEYFPEVIAPDAEEERHRVPWGLLYAIDHVAGTIEGGDIEFHGNESALALRPDFEYRDSTVIHEKRIEKDDGTTEVVRTETPVRLLARAHTYKGVYTYSYRWVTERDEGVRTMREVQDGWDFRGDTSKLEALLRERLDEEPSPELVMMVDKAGEAFTSGQESMEWLVDEEEMWITEAMGNNWESALPPAEGEFVWPVSAPMTSSFGNRPHPIFRMTRFHAGIDFGVKPGTPVRCTNDGVVRYAGRAGGYGLLVAVDHGGGIVSLYGHNLTALVGAGDSVERGQVICLSGDSGASTGPHLHFEIRSRGKPVDPIEIVANGGESRL